MKNNKKPNWEEEFEKKFTAFGNVYAHKKELTGFIKKQITKAKKEAFKEGVKFALGKLKLYNAKNAIYRMEPTSLGNQELAEEIEREYLKSLKEK